MMNTEDIDKIDKCKALLPEPAPEVVGELIAEVRRLTRRSQVLQDRLTEMENEFII